MVRNYKSLARKNITCKILYKLYKNIVLYTLLLAIIIVMKMKLLIPGSAGVLIACLIFTTLVLSRPSIETMLSSTSVPTDLRLSPITVRLTISGFTEPRGIGSQALLTINVTSNINVSNVVLQIDLRKAGVEWPSKGIELVSGATTWNGDLLANVPIILNIVVNATEVGYGVIQVEAKAIGYENWISTIEMGPIDYLGIVVLENEIIVFEDIGGALPYLFPPGFNPPIFPNPPDLSNMTGPLPYP